jgi:hypothetical protein
MAIKASSVEIERSELAAGALCGASVSSLIVKVPLAVRRARCGAFATAAPFGPYMRMAIDLYRSVSALEFPKTEALWLISSKCTGKFCRLVRFVPANADEAFTLSIQKL